MEEREELESLRQSLDMITSIMNAKNDSCQQNNVELANRAGEFIYYFAENLYKECLGYINEMEEAFFSDSKKVSLREQDIDEYVGELQEEVRKWFVLEQKTWLKNKIAVAFIGGFSSGKTTIVNRMLGEEHKMPVDRRATTAVATYVSYSHIGMVKFADFEYTVKCLDDNDILKKFTKFNDALKDFPTSKLVRNFIVEEDNPTLQTLQNVSILDTPGFENDDEDTKRAIEVINETDALFWVIDINKGDINAYSLKVIKEQIHEIPLYIVINKTDLKSPGERKSVIQKIRDTLEKNDVNVAGYIPFSKNTPIEEITTVLQSIKRKNSGELFAHIEKEFTDIIGMLQDRYIHHFNKMLRDNKRTTRDIEDKISEKERDVERLDKLEDDATENLGDLYSYSENFWNLFNTRVGYEKEKVQSLMDIGKFKLELEDIRDKKNQIDYCLKTTEALVNRCNDCWKYFKELTEPFTK